MTVDEKTEKKLPPRQVRFVQEYLIDLNATQAAIRAGYSLRTANAQAGRLLVNVSVQEVIQKRRSKLAAKVEVTQERIVAEYARLGFADMSTYVSWGPDGVKLKESSELPEGASLAVLEVSETTTKDGGAVRFKLHDKKGALDSLAKHLGMFPTDGATVNVDNRHLSVEFYVTYDNPSPSPAQDPSLPTNGANPGSG